ncbi:MAG: class I SAM-dependent methyltransferase [Anaerolineae bacterium]|nr:MAG: class I SAM-dependent methyltransferase [Anaerolineae bacterium]
MTKFIEDQDTISRESATDFYNWLGARHDWAEIYESKAKHQGLGLLNLAPGMRVLNAGCGTGKDHLELVEGVFPGGEAIALDLSWKMIHLTWTRTHAPCIQAAVERFPFNNSSFDRIYSSYVLDLIPSHYMDTVLSEFNRMLRPGGIMVNVSLSRGHTLKSKIVIWAWMKLYNAAPIICGGCRPVSLYELAEEVGFSQVTWEVVEQFGVPSEIVVAIR